MTTLMPAVWHSLTASGTAGRNGSAIPTRPRYSNGKPRGVADERYRRYGGLGQAEHPHAFARHFIGCRALPRAIFVGKMAEFRDGLGRALCRHDQRTVAGLLPYLCNRKQSARTFRLRLTMAKLRTRRRVWIRKRGGSVSICVMATPILPISLRAPVAVTLALPWPRTTRLPEYT